MKYSRVRFIDVSPAIFSDNLSQPLTLPYELLYLLLSLPNGRCVFPSYAEAHERMAVFPHIMNGSVVALVVVDFAN